MTMQEELAASIAAHRKRMDEIQREGLLATAELSALNARLILERGIAKSPEEHKIPKETIEHLVEVIHRGPCNPTSPEATG